VASNDRTYLIPAGIALVCVLLGGTSFAISGYFVSQAEDRHSWLPTPGVVITNSVYTYQTRDSKTGYWYEHSGRNMEYTYEVDGQPYVGSAYGFGDETVETVDFDAKYPIGTAVTVFYDPHNPSDAVLFKDAVISPTPFYALGIGLIVLGLPFGYLAYRMGRAR
jgi:hypothetical protein